MSHHLHVHTIYSAGDALGTSEEYASRMDDGALAITDHDTMAGHIDHHDACKKHDVTPIYGVEVTLANGAHLTLLAMNEEGYRNLCRMMHREKTPEVLRKYSEGVICLSGDLNGPLARAILDRDQDALQTWWRRLASIYGDRLYLEWMDHGLHEQEDVRHHLAKLSRPLVQTNDVHYPDQNDARSHAVFLADRLDKHIDLDWALDHGVDGAYLCDMPDQESANDIVERCTFELPVDDIPPILPNYTPPDDYPVFVDASDDPQEQFLLNLGIRKLRDKVDKDIEETYLPRLKHEWEIVCDMGYEGYYLIVYDFIQYAHDNGIPVGPGRGSGAGSLLAYVLGITDIDPIEQGLLFERFLNPARVSMPDFDIDFAYRQRDQVIDYVREKYGEKSVSAICTYGTCKPKEAWKTAARPMGVPRQLRDDFSDLYLPDTKEGKTFDDIAFDDAFDEHPEAETPIQMASEIEGAIRSVGRHAAGFVITPKQVEEYAPLSSEDRAVQYDMEAAERMGLVKFDFLGLKELDVIDYAQKLVGHDVDMPHGDEDTLDYISTGRTAGMFQINSEGFQVMMQKMKPDSFEDIVASVALYRPGPKDAGMVDSYIRRKHGEEDVEYPHSDLEECLEETYGVVVYQEQVMQIAQIIAGYSLGEADILRRAMGKKKTKVMNEQKPKFISQAQERGYSEELAKDLWSQIDTFSDYGFNKCLTGDTVLERAGANQYVDKYLTVEELYEAQFERDDKGHLTSWAVKIQDGRQKILQYCPDGRIRPGNVVQVHKSGVQEVFQVSLCDGKTVKATSDHRFLTDQGYKTVDNLGEGDCLVIRGEESGYEKKGHHTTRARGETYEGEGFYEGEDNPSYIDGRSILFKKAKQAVKDRSNGVCEKCGHDEDGHRYEFAHKEPLEDLDFDYSNYHSPDNILYLCNSCHKKLDYQKGERRPAWSKGKPSSTAKVKSVEYVGEEMTYDVEMDDPYHNFIANGVVSHNSHAASYAQITWETAYLKTHHRPELLAAQMDIRHGNAEAVSAFIREAEREDIPVYEPDVQSSAYRFTTEDDAIRVGLCAIKNLNDDVARQITDQAPFDDVADLVMQVSMSKGDLQALLYAGALDDLMGAESEAEKCRLRAALEAQMSDILQAADGYQANEQPELFSPSEVGIAFDPTRGEAWSKEALASREYDYLERYRTLHPAKLLKGVSETVDIADWKDAASPFRICGVIRKVNDYETKNGNMMGFVLLEDETGSVDMTVFPDDWDPELFTERRAMCYIVRRDTYEGEPTLNLQKICKNLPSTTTH